MDNALTIASGAELHVGRLTKNLLRVSAPDDRVLLSITSDGTVEGAIEDMGDAAVVFVSELRRLIELGALGI